MNKFQVLFKYFGFSDEQEEKRCDDCAEEDCPARNKGVLYPCPHFKNVLE